MMHVVERTVYYSHPSEKPLRGCAAIAEFLGESRRQIYRLKKQGLPVWREGNQGSPLRAYPHELVEWRKQRREESS